MAEDIRVRIAPSPTGNFHLGTARTALYNYLFAKKNNGKFILRIEDTDVERSKEEFVIDIEESMTWLGLAWDEGPETDGKFGPYKQSERSKIYQKYIDRLLQEKKAYYCYCTHEELETERKAQEEKHLAPMYSGRCRNLSEEEIKKFVDQGRKPAIRFNTDTGESSEIIKFVDLVHGKMEFDSKLIGDFIIAKPDGSPIFLLTNIIDDAEMKISHVLRGEDHLSNTPKQLMLADALALSVPEYGHFPMILNPDRSKLSKRKNPTSVTRDYRDQGYLPEAVINFIALLGWSPTSANKQVKKFESTKEIFTLDELVDEFSLVNVGKSPAIFDQTKLDYLNGYYIRKLPIGELARRCLPYLISAKLIDNKKGNPLSDGSKVLAAVCLVQERMKKISEIADLTSFLFSTPKYDAKLLIPKNSSKEKVRTLLSEAVKILESEKDFTRDGAEQILRALAIKLKINSGEILWPIRVALSGKTASPGAFELIDFFGELETIKRIKTAIDMLQ
jgi:glutamyl-tRNA synthetase